MELLDRILANALRTPQAPALHGAEQDMSYAQLWERATGIAAWLATLPDAQPEPGPGPGDERVAAQDRGRGPVALLMAKSTDMAAAMLGVLLEGRAYVPVDPALPPQRRADMIADSRAAALIVAGSAGADGEPDGAVASLPVLSLALLPLGAVTPVPMAQRAAQPADASADAAILFTSGSTNRPKGVRLSRRAFDVFVAWAIDYFDLGPEDRVASHAPFGFDISILDLFAALAAGASVHLVPGGQMTNGRYLTDFIVRQGITLWQSVPTALCAIGQDAVARRAAADPRLPATGLRHIATTGEPLPAACRADLAALSGTAILHNIYGCTETNDSVVFSVALSDAMGEGQLPIGRALPFADCRIVDDQRRDVAPGSTGELMVASATAFTGYTDPELTRQALVYLADGRGPYYATRDQVVEDDQGLLHFVGRVDHTIKLRGIRIDLREVEAALAAASGHAEVMAVAMPCAKRGRQLVGVLGAGAIDGATLSPVTLKTRCAELLPRLSIPDRFVTLPDRLPRNANGKIDRRRVTDLVAGLPGFAAPSPSDETTAKESLA